MNDSIKLPRANHWCKKNVKFPPLASERLVDPSRHIAGRGPETDEKNHGTRHQSATVRRRQESKACEDERDERHDENLHARTDENREKHPLARWSENVAVNQFPAEFFLSVFSRVNLR